jgi:hypothetical protein
LFQAENQMIFPRLFTKRSRCWQRKVEGFFDRI